MNKLEQHINNSPLVRAAILESVRRFYYDRICSPNQKERDELEELQVGDILSTLWNLQPNWQFVIENSTKRYSPDPQNTSAVAICGKPTNPVSFTVEITIK